MVIWSSVTVIIISYDPGGAENTGCFLDECQKRALN